MKIQDIMLKAARLAFLIATVRVLASVTAEAQPGDPPVGLTSENYELIGGSLVSAAEADMTGPNISLSGASLGEPSVGPTMASPSGVTLEPGFWPIVAAPEPGTIGCAAAALLTLMSLRRFGVQG